MSSSAIHSHSYDLPSANTPSSSVNALGMEEEGKERSYTHSHSHDKQVGKGGKKRSRGGKSITKAEPITILATDPSYFRAMVQRLTGVPSPSSSYTSPPGGEYNTQVALPTTLHPSTSLHGPIDNYNNLVSNSNPTFINPNPNPYPYPLPYAHQDHAPFNNNNNNNNNDIGGFTPPDYLDQLRLMLLLGNSNDPFPTTTSTTSATTYSSIAPSSSPSLHHYYNNNNINNSININNNSLESWWSSPSPNTSPMDYPH